MNSVKAGDLMGPRPGEHCIVCGEPILINDQWTGAKGDYCHTRCHNMAGLDAMKKVRKFDQYGIAREYEIPYVADNDYEAYEDGYSEDIDYQRGYDDGYKNGISDDVSRRADERMLRNELDSVRAQLDRLGVPAKIDYGRHGPGQAGRLAWYLDRTSYKIYEIGHPDAIT